MYKYFIILLLSVCVAACSNDASIIDETLNSKETAKADGISDDVIMLSTKSVTLNGEGGLVIVKTEGQHWWITDIVVDGEMLYSMTNNADDVKETAETGNFTAQCGWLTVKVENWKITVTAMPNEDGGERTFSIGLECGDYFDRIEGKQEPKILDGIWDDNIKLSTKEVTLNSKGEPATIKAEGRHWWITDIMVDGEMLYSMDGNTDDMEKLAETGNFTAQCGWLTVKVENWEITVTATPNDNGSERTFSIGLECGDYFDRIKGKQEAITSGIRLPVVNK